MQYRRGERSVISGLVACEHWFDVPLDWAKPNDPGMGLRSSIKVFCRELVDPVREGDQLPYLLFLQGGPGFGSPRPVCAAGWIKRAVAEYRVILLDQRGTGLSTPVTAASLSRLQDVDRKAQYLKNFRADSIVRDCEHIRETLLGKGSKWVVLGQSFGGFCLTTYLSMVPSSIELGLFTGGLPPVNVHPDDVYRATYRRVIERTDKFYERYPQDVRTVQKIVRYLHSNTVKLPSGGILTPRRFLQLGIMLGSQTGVEAIHYLIEDAFVEGEDALSYNFLRKVDTNQSSWDTNPIYSVLHEPIYNEGFASKWSAYRVITEFPEFDFENRLTETDAPLYFTGEMVYPWMFDGCYAELKGMKDVAEALASSEDWGKLYDLEKLAQCKVPCAAAVYYGDMYVDLKFSADLAKKMGNCKMFITNEYQHNGIWEDGETILSKLLDMCHGRVNIPS